ncbi:site-specific integrase [Paraburkholderia phymatum]|uniref:Integrase family protein n=1 Tax=Paraburkholderia phymatum (strain DSM 17167 / CIP 108236 / LMG 21445 / STM815) TaxID=391038 RepID=B2JU61_PARP8|nr:site-specific integrase [Paraburkholderia phymatum]ACC76114.1 integrase family protein [Paraburkholderia phymatum STM815]
MATFQERKNSDGSKSYRATIRRKGHYASETFSTREEADQWAIAIETRIAGGAAIEGGDITPRTTVRDLIARYMREVSTTKKGSYAERNRLGTLLDRYSVFDKTIVEFSSTDIEAVRDARMRGSKDHAPVSALTVIRDLGCLSGVFRHAIKKWKAPFTVNPCKEVDRPRAPRGRSVRVRDDDMRKLLDWSGYVPGADPANARQWMAWSVLFALETAMRRGEFMRMRWTDINRGERGVHLPDTKNDEARDVPLTKKALALLDSLTEGKPEDRVIGITYHTFGNAFYKCQKATGINVRIHDCRHEATTNLAKRVKDPLWLASITGHRDLRSLKIYFNPTTRELAEQLDDD